MVSVVIGVVGSTVIVALATALCILGLLAIPGRKGYISEDFTEIWQSTSVEAATGELAARLHESGFTVSMPDVQTIHATRPRRAFKHRSLDVNTCESAQLSASAHLSKRIQDVEVRLRLKHEDLILLDTTESSYLRALGAFLVSGSQTANPPPVVSQFPGAWLVISTTAFLGLMLSLSLLTPYWPEGQHLEHYVLHINGWLGIWIGLIVSHSTSAAKVCPKLVRPFAYAPLVGGVALVSSAILYFHLRESHVLATVTYAVLAVCPLELSEFLERFAEDGAKCKQSDEMEV